MESNFRFFFVAQVSFNAALHRSLQWDFCLELLATAEANNAWPDEACSYGIAGQKILDKWNVWK